jgi:hypothetical protein
MSSSRTFCSTTAQGRQTLAPPHEARRRVGRLVASVGSARTRPSTREGGGRAEKTGKVFVGDRVAMVSATFGEDLWSCRGVGLGRVMTTIKSRNTKPVKIVLEAATEAEEKKRRAIAFKELSDTEKAVKKQKDDDLLADMLQEDRELLKKGLKKGFFGLF